MKSKHSATLLKPNDGVVNVHDNNHLGLPDSHDAVAKAARCLRDYLAIYGRQARAYRVLQFLAEEALSRIQNGLEPVCNNIAIQQAVQGKATDDPSGWLSPIWADITQKLMPEREVGLQAFARDRGLSIYPWPIKIESAGGAGNQALYRIQARPLPPPETDSVAAPTEVVTGTTRVTYIPELRPKPAWWVQWLFEKEFAISGWRKWAFVAVPLSWLLLVMIFLWVTWAALSHNKQPVTSQHLMLILAAAGIAFYSMRLARSFEHFLDDRIAIAPIYLVALSELGVCIELFRPGPETDSPRVMRLVRYASQCPICKSQVLVDSGDPDFPRRLVGRCQESPREHVFSFDRVTRVGILLR